MNSTKSISLNLKRFKTNLCTCVYYQYLFTYSMLEPDICMDIIEIVNISQRIVTLCFWHLGLISQTSGND